MIVVIVIVIVRAIAHAIVIVIVPIVIAIKKRSHLTRAFCMICLDLVGPFIKRFDGILIV